MISFTITEKGYGVAPADLERGLTPVLAMGKVTALLYERSSRQAAPDRPEHGQLLSQRR